MDIARQLQQAGVIRQPYLFAAVALTGRYRHKPGLKAGEYAFTPHESLQDVMGQMRAGRVVIHKLTIPEGLTIKEIAAVVANEPDLSGEIGPLPDEGTLWPETYDFSRADSRAGLIQRMHAAAEKELQSAWQTRAPNLPLKSPHEALVLASIVEKETGSAGERPKVAAVFYNRLKAGMKLQSDSTIIYVLSHGQGVLDRPLGHSDLSLESPYNTYAINGLPPGPICNPGKASLMAVMQPDTGPELYFVATGTGGHAFAATLDQHNRNVAQYIKNLHDRVHDKP
jgi:UPF0755 protein